MYYKLTIIILIITCLACNNNEEKDTLIDFKETNFKSSKTPILIAHRGGVITPQSPECSIFAIQLAKREGYSMVELDIRMSKDEVPVVFHDSNMKNACGINKKIKDLNADEIVRISYVNSNQTICTLDDALSVCYSLKLGIMLDIKVNENKKFYQKIVELIKKHGLENSCVTINGQPELRKQLYEVAMLTVTQDEFNKVKQGLTIDLSHKFWFGLPQQLPGNTVKLLQQNGALVIPAINTFRYPDERHYELADKDIQRLNEARVDGYQIDSVYGPLFQKQNK